MHSEFPILLGAGLVLLGIFYLGFLSLKINFPSVILYILFGIILADVLSENEILHFASEIGIVLLFFLLGLEFSVKRLGGIAKKIWTSGLLDVGLSLGVSMLFAFLFGMDWFSAFIVGGITYATSSSITAKLLDDKSRMANAETEFILALLIFEDLIAPIVVAVILGVHMSGTFQTSDLLLLFGKIIGLAALAIILGKTVFKRFEELLVKIDDEDIKIALLIGLSVSFGGLALFLGLSEVLGAFLAGMMLAEIGKIERVEHTVSPVKDLMLPTFFVYFGTTIQLGDGLPLPWLIVVLLLWSMVAKILVGVVGGRWYGLSKKVSLRAGLSICARGEFSVVIASVATGTVKILGGIYILIAAFIGMILFDQAPKIANRIYGKGKKPDRNLKVPGT
ncbi:cation:proton antiporter [Radiobacillus kanasensis]|uniref:cation:proton antiporter n=1 Tax=Radiobacillus kanasensis TaxID=2844358 RepID=UPI001E637C2C|nr:cation:proton antiporter [Radiobacillus kanasensis]UFT98205.1 cation:proton antiporter [Radiobacillus kanasensis]